MYAIENGLSEFQSAFQQMLSNREDEQAKHTLDRFEELTRNYNPI